MIWVKRLVPLVILVGIYFGYGYYTDVQKQTRLNQATLHAEVTAKLWLASAYYRNDTDRFVIYRDSILSEADISLDKAVEYLDLYSSESEQYRSFSAKVAELVDSLAIFDKSYERTSKPDSI